MEDEMAPAVCKRCALNVVLQDLTKRVLGKLDGNS